MTAHDDILEGRTSLGIELGSTRIKACLIGTDAATVLGAGSHGWENRWEGGHWTYSLDEVERGVQAAYADLVAQLKCRYGVQPTTFGAIGVSAMMHGYLAFDATGELLVPFRTWRDTTTAAATAELTELFGVNIPLRWSIAHLHQAVIDAEPHVGRIATVTTLAGYVHRRLTGRVVLGVGDASGMFPIDSARCDYDEGMVSAYEGLTAGRIPAPLRELLPDVLTAGSPAGSLTAAGAAYLDPSGTLRPGVPLCPPEGDAGTGMVATNSVSPRTGNVSVGTSIFAMVALERRLVGVHREIDLVTTPTGDPVAMVHCNNGASELGAWVALFIRFAAIANRPIEEDAAYEALFREALEGAADAGGLISFNHLSGEPIADLVEGRPLVVRGPESALTLGNFMRSQLYGVFGTLALGMQSLSDEGVEVDRMFAHGGVFRTEGVAQRFLASVLRAPVAVGDAAAEGGAWGMAVLASYLRAAATRSLGDYLNEQVFADAGFSVSEPQGADVVGFSAYLERYRDALAIEHTAVAALNGRTSS
ncbi:ATPase [Leucobacter weissii]|uniref:ATPase n=1 Tax=Leucobacter weissii TaxID=1983706 RepID=A0A939MHI9_9MICO|nr:FGGY-family carbohydrate kinase [Leucobacter weissii]MBO1901034.1 ATPase [Leucobacter weissii]